MTVCIRTHARMDAAAHLNILKSNKERCIRTLNQSANPLKLKSKSMLTKRNKYPGTSTGSGSRTPEDFRIVPLRTL